MRMTRKSVLSMALAALTCLGVACGGDESDSSNGGDDSQATGGTDSGGSGGNMTTGGSGSSGGTTNSTGGQQTTPPLLDDDVAGAECSDASACGPMGECLTELTGGALSRFGVEPVAVPGGYCSAGCTSSAQCGDGGACFGAFPGTSGECRAACLSNDDCRDGYECAMLNVSLGGQAGAIDVVSTCQPLPETVQLDDDEAGMTCATDDDCANGTCANGGCTGTCTEDAHCGAGGACIKGLYGSAGSCVESCTMAEDCQNFDKGYGCSTDGLCVPRLKEGLVGQACAAASEDTDCPGGACREASFGTTYPEGYCVGSCDVDADCFAGGVCINGTTCLLGCTDTSECRAGYECMVHPLADEESQGTICFPAPADTDADAGMD